MTPERTYEFNRTAVLLKSKAFIARTPEDVEVLEDALREAYAKGRADEREEVALYIERRALNVALTYEHRCLFESMANSIRRRKAKR